MTLPDDECEWCGEPIKWVQLMPHAKISMRIDAEPRAADDPLGTYRRVHPLNANGRIDCVKPITEDERSRYRYAYTPHKKTCRNADMWASGHVRAMKKSARLGARRDITQVNDPDSDQDT